MLLSPSAVISQSNIVNLFFFWIRLCFVVKKDLNYICTYFSLQLHRRLSWEAVLLIIGLCLVILVALLILRFFCCKQIDLIELFHLSL